MRPVLERRLPVAWSNTIPSTAEWSEADVKGVIGSTPYRNPTAPGHAAWRGRVGQYYTERSQGSDRDCGGVADVRAYTRMGRSGPVDMSAHTRGIPCG